ncbi:hypothetical protein [Martelella sp. HB161492]|uniref:hypothetical protein n=1 Tax=Martelella sp. HB161492 TaxID=2720726 RepID=UPI00158FE63B|nr:hypothetical protein [Martelella sp. HB161492]
MGISLETFRAAWQRDRGILWQMMRLPLVIAIILAAVFATDLMPKAEGYAFPVVEDTDITRTVTYERPSEWQATMRLETIFYGIAEKRRACSYDHVDWYLKTGRGDVKVNITFYEPDKIREAGDFAFGPWGTMLTPDQLKHQSYAIVWHRCHFGWLTATHFYP